MRALILGFNEGLLATLDARWPVGSVTVLEELAGEASSYAGVRKIMAERAGIFRGIDGLEMAAQVPGIVHVAVERMDGASVRLPPLDYTSSTLGVLIAQGASPDAVRSSLDTALSYISVRFEDFKSLIQFSS